MKLAIFGTCYVKNEYDSWLVRQWQNVTQKLNPNAHIYLIDSASPYMFYVDNNVKLIQQGENIGHLSKGGRDGWGKSFCTAIDILAPRYDWLVHIESDLIMVQPVMESMIQPTMDANAMFGAPCEPMYDFLETGLLCMKSSGLRAVRFIERYDWQHPENKGHPENRVKSILKPYLHTLKLRGCRAEGNFVDSNEFTYLTHASKDDISRMIISSGFECV